jgi:hypothetical protein
MPRLAIAATTLIASLSIPVVAAAQAREPVDLAVLARIREEGMQRSQVMEHIIWLSDIYGPRLTGSPTIQQAADWTMGQFRKWGLSNVHLERFPFGKGWSLQHFSAVMTEPQVQPIIGLPQSWTRGTNGPVTADVVLAQISTEEDMNQWRGKLRGKILLTQPARAVRMLEGPIVLRMTPEMIREAEAMPAPRGGGAGGRGGRGAAAGDSAGGRGVGAAGGGRGGGAAAGGRGGRGGGGGGPSLADRIAQFYNDEGVVALFDRGGNSDMSAGGSDLSWQTQRTDGGTFFVGSGGSRDSTAGRGVPEVTLAVEHYNRMVRILERGIPVKVALDIRTRFHDETQPNGFNVIAELPGTDLRDEIVVIGGHFDSHHGGTGATDNATGVAQMMEAVRILQAVGVRPRRTIRLAFWGAEENGLIGSRVYVQQHLATRDSAQRLVTRPEYDRTSVYFNSDNGTGRFVGIWLQSNEAVRPIFEQWIAPLRDLGVTVLGPRSVASTDHASFDNVGIPAFQFMVDRLEYNSRTHHSNMDVVDRVQPDDVKQAATVAATFAYLAAMRDEKLPRKPVAQGGRGRGGGERD